MKDDELISATWSSVRQSSVPEEMEGIAFKELLRARLRIEAGANVQTGRAPVVTPPPPTPEADGGAAIDTNAAYTTLAGETGIDEDEIREVILFEASGEVHLLPHGRQLGSNNTSRARNVVSLIAGARNGAFGDRSINVEVIRSECQDKKCYDQGNFKSNHLGKHEGVSVRGDEVYVNTSKWRPMFEKALATARGQDATQ